MNRVFAPYPASRPRRLRRDAATRALVREHRRRIDIPVLLVGCAVALWLGLSEPVPQRFLTWAGDVLTGDLGTSYRDGESVSDAIRQRLPNSLQIMLMTQMLALLLAVPAALWAANRPGQRPDRTLSSASFAMLVVLHADQQPRP